MSWRKNLTLGLLLPFSFFGLESKVEKNYKVETREEVKIEKTLSGLESKVFALPKVKLDNELLQKDFKKALEDVDAFFYNVHFIIPSPDFKAEFTAYFMGYRDYRGDVMLSMSTFRSKEDSVFVTVPILDEYKNKIGERYMVKARSFSDHFSKNEIKKNISEEVLLAEEVPYMLKSYYTDSTLANNYSILRYISVNFLKAYSRLIEALYIPLKRNKINSSIIHDCETLILNNSSLNNFFSVMSIDEVNVEELHWRTYLMFLSNRNNLAKNNFNLTFEVVNSPVYSYQKIEKIYGYLSPKLLSVLNFLTNFSVFEPNATWTYDKYDQFYSRLRNKNKDLESMIDQWIDKEISTYGKNLNNTQIQNIKNNIKVAIAVYNDMMNRFAEDSIMRLTDFITDFYVKIMDTHNPIRYVTFLPETTPLLSFFKQYFTSFNHVIVNSGYSEELRKKYNISGFFTFEAFGFWFDAEEFYKTKYLPVLETVMREYPVISLSPYYFIGCEELNKLWFEHYKPFYEKYAKYLDVYRLAEQKVR